MSIRTIKQAVVYFLVFVILLGLTSTFTSKDFIGQAGEIGLKGGDLIKMQVALNHAESFNGQESTQKDQTPEDVNLDSLKEEEQRETYQEGDTHDRIKEFQEILVELGHLKGTPDGMFGGMTKNGVKEYQEKEGLETTGTLNAETQIALEASKKQGEQQGEEGSEADQGEEQQDQEEPKENNRKASIEHIVKNNETISQISQRYDVPVNEILQANQLSGNAIINIGQKLIIPQN